MKYSTRTNLKKGKQGGRNIIQLKKGKQARRSIGIVNCVRWKGYEEKDDTWQNWRDFGEEESTQSTLLGSRKTSLRETSPHGLMAKFVARSAAKNRRSQELDSSPKRVPPCANKCKWKGYKSCRNKSRKTRYIKDEEKSDGSKK